MDKSLSMGNFLCGRPPPSPRIDSPAGLCYHFPDKNKLNTDRILGELFGAERGQRPTLEPDLGYASVGKQFYM